MSSADQPNTLRDRMLSKMAGAFNRADELGGDLRDYLRGRYEQSERAQALAERLGTLRGKKKKFEVRKRDRKPSEATGEAPAPTTQTMYHQEGLGNPNVSAQIFGRTSCPWTGRTIRLLEDRKVDYDYIDLDELEDGALATKLLEETKQNTVPYVFLGGQFVGGYNATAEIDRLGQLEFAILAPQVRAEHRDAGKIVIASRPNTDEVAPADVGET